MIAGLEDVSEGEIFINGQRVNDLEPKDRDVAMVFQSYALYPNMTVYENIRFPLKIGELTNQNMMSAFARRRQWLNWMNFLTVNQQSYLVVSDSSGITRAIVREPNVFLMDEPLSNLDAKLRCQLGSDQEFKSRTCRNNNLCYA